MSNKTSFFSIAGICCAAGIYGIGCLKCTCCVAGAVGCSVGLTICYDCIQKRRRKRQDKDPKYVPLGPPEIIDRSNNR